MTKRTLGLLCFLCLLACPAFSQSGNGPVNTQQQTLLQGVRTAGTHGSFTAAAYAPDGSLILLYDQHDGIRLLKTDPTATTLLAQSQQGAVGDSGLALTLDPSGNIYVTGTTTSTTLTGSTGTAFPTRADTTTNSFLAKYDANLNPQWLTFLGAGTTSAAALTATSNAILITGITASQTFPVTPSAIQQTPSPNNNQNGFAESFTPTGSLTYATYLNGTNGNTTPTGIAADANGNAYITGSTTASGFPTLNALVANILTTPSGFLTALNPTGSAFLYSTFIPGLGLNSIAVDAPTQTLLLTGNIAPGQFPLTTVANPLVATEYQSLLRLPLNAQSITSSTVLIPGTQSYATPGPNSTVWVSGTLTTPLFPGETAPASPIGDTFLLELTAPNPAPAAMVIAQTLRIGGLPTNNPAYSTLTTTAAAPAVNTTSVALPATLTTSTPTTFLTTQTFDFPFTQAPNTLLPNTLADTVPTPAICPNSSQCTGTAALLSLIKTNTSAPSLTLSTNTLPNLTLRNIGSATATTLNLTATGYTLTSNCPTNLPPSNACTLALTGSGPGILTVSAANSPAQTINLPATTLTPNPIALSTTELDFGILTSTSPALTRTLTLTNLTSTPQTFTAANAIPFTSSDFALTATTCGSLTALTLAASSTCTLTLTFTASPTVDKPESALFLIANQTLKLTGFSQVASLNLSSTEIDFGTQYTGSPTLPRYLYLSNNSTLSIPHTPVTLPTTSPFTLIDNCPLTLTPHSICQLTLTYSSPIAPSDDATTLTLDNNLTVLVTGQTLPQQGVTGSTPNPSLTVSTTAIDFATPVTVTALSGTQQTITLTNSGTIPFTLNTALTGDFQLTGTCPATLAAAASCQLYLTFAPAQPGQRDGLLALTAGSGFAPTLVTLTGTSSAILPADNGTLSLGQTYAGEPTQIFLPITQSLPSLTAATNSSNFNIAIVPNTGTTPTPLSPSAFTATSTVSCTSCYLAIQFLSQTSGPYATTLTLTTVPNGNPYQLTLTATALPVSGLVLTPITQDFGPIPLHSTSAPITFTLANLLNPATTATITSVSLTGDFTQASNTTGGAACTGTLAGTATCFTQVTFAPTALGPRNGTLTIVTSAGTITSTLTGYGAPDPGLALNPTALNFNLTPNTSAGTQTITLTNTGTATLSLSTPSTSTGYFTSSNNCTTLAPTATCTITVNFIPTTAPVTDTLSIPVTATLNGQSELTVYTVPLAGNYTRQDSGLLILPAQVNFGASPTAPPTTPETRQFTLTNLTSTQQIITLTMPRQFPLADGSACTTLAPAATCTFTASFLPTTNGPITGTIFAQGTSTTGTPAQSPAQSLAYMLGYGTGPAALTITGYPIPNSPLAFGQLTSGQTTSQTLTLTNAGTTPLTIHRITSNPPFLATTTCGQTLTPKSACTVTLTYAPIYELPTASTSLTPRNDAGQLILESDAATSPVTIPLTGSVTPVLSSSPASSSTLATFFLTQGALTFPNTAVGNASATQTVTLTNTGTTLLHITSVTASTDFTSTNTCTTTLPPGGTCTLTAQFSPTTANTSTIRSGTLQISSDAATSLDFITLLGISAAAPLTLTPTALDFGTLNVNTSGSLPITVTNTTAAPITFLDLNATGDYTAALSTCPALQTTLAAGASCTLTATFTPTTNGTLTGTLSLTTDATTLPLTVSLTGIGAAGALTAAPATLAFGNIALNSPQPLTLILTNHGTAIIANLTNAITGPNAADFNVSSPCSSASLAPNQACTETVTFTPSALGARTATLAIATTDPASPLLIPLTGTGIAANGSFLLTVNGTAAQTITVASGTPATYALSLTPLNSFTGTVALTCTPVIPAQYATCSLLAPTLTLTSSQPQTSAATINTITTTPAFTTVQLLALLLVPTALFTRKRRRPANILTACLLTLTLSAISGCGGGRGTNIRYTPPGTYQYTVTASSTSGPAVTSTVTLNLIVH